MKSMLDALTAEGGSFASVKDAIADTDLSDVNVTGAKLYLLSTSEAGPYKNLNFSGVEYGGWWLRSPGFSDEDATVVLGENLNFSGVEYGGWWLRSPGFSDEDATVVLGEYGAFAVSEVELEFGVRPALKLNLSSVIFDSESKEFSLKSSHTHSFTYVASGGATITATCNADGCTLDDGTEQHKHAVTLTIVKPTLTTYGQTGEGISEQHYLLERENSGRRIQNGRRPASDRRAHQRGELSG